MHKLPSDMIILVGRLGGGWEGGWTTWASSRSLASGSSGTAISGRMVLGNFVRSSLSIKIIRIEIR